MSKHVVLPEGVGHADVAREFEELVGGGMAGCFVTESPNIDLVVCVLVVMELQQLVMLVVVELQQVVPVVVELSQQQMVPVDMTRQEEEVDGEEE